MFSWWVTALRHQFRLYFSCSLFLWVPLGSLRSPWIWIYTPWISSYICSAVDQMLYRTRPVQINPNSSVRPLTKPLVGSTATWKSCCCPQMGSQNMHVQSISNTEVSLNLHTQSWWSVGTNKTIRSCVLWELYPPQFVNSFLPSVLYICIHRHLQSIWQMFLQWETMFLYHSYGHLMLYPH